MDFDKAVAAFVKKTKSYDVREQKRQQYIAMLKEYQALKYGAGRKEREITQELVEKREQDKKDVSLEVADDLAQYLEIDLDIGIDGDLDMGAPKGKTK